MKPYSYYTDLQIECPNKSNYTVKYFYKHGKLILIKKPFSVVDDVPEGAVEESVFDSESYEAHFKAWLKEKTELEQEFKEDLILTEGVSDREKAEKCFSLAWDYGCSGGLHEVHQYFRDLVKLVK